MTTEGTPLITDEMRKAIGAESEPRTTVIERGAIEKFADAIGDPNPLYVDEVKAGQSRYGGIIAPPTFLRSIRTGDLELPFKINLTRTLDGGSDWEYFEPVRAGDTITAVTRLADLTERTGRLGPMLFVIREISYTNQQGTLVAKQRGTLIRY